MAAYESELTGFLRTLRANPGVADRQREGRALWWDRPTDPEDQQRWDAARVRASAYQYYPPLPRTGSGS